jgi:SSS family solute:Na+ symporter
MTIFSPVEGALLFAVYGIIMYALTYYFTQRVTNTKEGYLLADRDIGTFLGAVSISSAWIWAGAIFLSSEIAYKWGWPGLFYFSVMNILTLFLFAPFAQRIRNAAPQGFTWSSYLREQFGTRVQSVYLILFVAFVICVLTFNIFAASKLVQTLTGIDFAVTSVVLTALALLYNLRKGLRATMVTEAFKLAVVAAAVLLVVPALFYATDGWSTLAAGINGISGKYTTLWGTAEAWTLFISYGLITLFSHWANPWADNSFHQRAFAVDKTKVFKTFSLATVLFAGIPLLIGTIGFFAVGAGIKVEGAAIQMINVIAIAQLLPSWMLVVFAFAAFAAMVSIADSQLTSLGSLMGHDVHERVGSTADPVKFSRWAMLVVATLVVALVNIPGFTLLYLVMVIAMVRIATLFPSLLALNFRNSVTSTGLFWGMLSGIVIGIPLYAYGAYFKMADLAMTGFFVTLVIVPVLVLIVSRFTRKQN